MQGEPPPFYPIEAERVELDEISEVVSGCVWMSNFRGASRPEPLRALSITHIVAVGTEFEDDDMDGFTYWKRSLQDDDADGGAMAQVLRDGATYIDGALRRGEGVLVHCAAGISRSATVVLAHSIMFRHLSLRAAFEELISVRRVIWPNDSFMQQLILLEQELTGAPASITMDEYTRWAEYDGATQAGAGRCPRLGRASTFVDYQTRLDALRDDAPSSAPDNSTTRVPIDRESRRVRAAPLCSPLPS